MVLSPVMEDHPCPFRPLGRVAGDAAAMALAITCARTPASCASQGAVAARIANQNAKDGHSLVTAICGTGQGLTACPTAWHQYRQQLRPRQLGLAGARRLRLAR